MQLYKASKMKITRVRRWYVQINWSTSSGYTSWRTHNGSAQTHGAQSAWREKGSSPSRLVCFWQQRISEVAQTSKAADWLVIAASVAHTPKCTAGYPAVAVAPAPREGERGPVAEEAPRLRGTRSRSCCKSGASAPGGGYNNARHVALLSLLDLSLTTYVSSLGILGEALEETMEINRNNLELCSSC